MDSNYAGCLDIRNSLIGYVFTSFETEISWKVPLQKVIALSTTEIKYIVMT